MKKLKFSQSTVWGYVLGNMLGTAIGLIVFTIMTALGSPSNIAWGIVVFVMMGFMLFYGHHVFRDDIKDRMIFYVVLVGFVILTMFVFPMPPAIALAGVLLAGSFLGVHENQRYSYSDISLGIVTYPAVAAVAAFEPFVGSWLALLAGAGMFTVQHGLALILYAKERKEEAA